MNEELLTRLVVALESINEKLKCPIGMPLPTGQSIAGKATIHKYIVAFFWRKGKGKLWKKGQYFAI